jgi:para-nitrobenzyl esterase
LVQNLVRVAQGLIEGVTSPDGKVTAFRGVPYARPPLGEGRWRPPRPPESWAGVRHAHHFAASSIQPQRPATALTYTGETSFSEDCLYLNIWTGAESPDDKRPVWVWLHFGAFLMGSGSAALWDGEALARAGAVVVTLNFRLGRLGFLAHPDLSRESPTGTSGNYGLLDQLEALAWVRSNIDRFGGDECNVTLVGQSSGAASVSMLMASPLAVGLFHRAIGQSGGQFETPQPNVGFPSLSLLPDAELDGVTLQRSLGARSIDDLRHCPSARLLEALSHDGAVNWRAGIYNPAFIGAYPIVDGWVVPEAGLQAIYQEGRQMDVPLLTGSNANEGAGKLWMRDLASYERAAHEQFGELAEQFLRTYPAGSDEDAIRIGSQVVGDRLFGWQNWAWANLHRKQSRSPVYYYHFSLVPPFPPGARFSESSGDPALELGAMHGMEIPYVCRNLPSRDWPWRPVDQAMSDTMSTYWLNFARHGDPNGAGLPAWPVWDARRRAMIFDEEAREAHAPHAQRFQFWDRHFAARD